MTPTVCQSWLSPEVGPRRISLEGDATERDRTVPSSPGLLLQPHDTLAHKAAFDLQRLQGRLLRLAEGPGWKGHFPSKVSAAQRGPVVQEVKTSRFKPKRAASFLPSPASLSEEPMATSEVALISFCRSRRVETSLALMH